MLNAQHLERAFFPAYLAAVEKFFARAVRETDFDTVVVTGASGLLVGPQLARAHGKNILLVRKPNDTSHSHHPLTGYQGRKLLLLDDFVSTGETVARTLVTTARYWQSAEGATWTGVFLWADEEPNAARRKLGGFPALVGAPAYACHGYLTSGSGELYDWVESVDYIPARNAP